MLIIVLYNFTFFSACGQFIELTGGATRSISVSNSYAPYSNCIWVIEASSGYRVEFTITSFVGQSLSGSCVDYITVGKNSYKDALLKDGLLYFYLKIKRYYIAV